LLRGKRGERETERERRERELGNRERERLREGETRKAHTERERELFLWSPSTCVSVYVCLWHLIAQSLFSHMERERERERERIPKCPKYWATFQVQLFWAVWAEENSQREFIHCDLKNFKLILRNVSSIFLKTLDMMYYLITYP